MAQLRTLIIGLGQIGALYDIDGSQALPLTHLKAISDNKNYSIQALVDPSTERCNRVKEAKNLPADIFYESLADIPRQGFDVVVLACPPRERVAQLQTIVNYKPKVIVFEKPIGMDLPSANEILNICEQYKIKAVVNFHRRYDPDHNNFYKQLPQTPPYKIVFHYTKGLWNYGSHGIDLIQNWFGPVRRVINAFGLDDVIDGLIELESGTLVHLVAHKGEYDLFEFEFFYIDAKYNLRDGGLCKTRQTMEKDRHHVGYNHLGDEESIMPPDKVYGLEQLYEDVAKACVDQTYSLKGCHLDEAISGMKTIEQLIKYTE